MTSRRNFIQYFTLSLFVSACHKSEENKNIVFVFPTYYIILSYETPVEILWESKFIEKLDLFYSLDNGITWLKIAEKIDASDDKYLWLPKKINAEKIKLKLQDHDDTNYFTISTPFELYETATIYLDQVPEAMVDESIVTIKNKKFDDFAILNLGNNRFKTFSLSCTHSGCTIMLFNDAFECPCHGSMFNKKGCVKQGPAKENLAVFYNEFDLKANKLIVFRKQIKDDC